MMPDYSDMYQELFRAQTEALELIRMATELSQRAISIMKKAQQDTEEIYISASDVDGTDTFTPQQR